MPCNLVLDGYLVSAAHLPLISNMYEWSGVHFREYDAICVLEKFSFFATFVTCLIHSGRAAEVTVCLSCLRFFFAFVLCGIFVIVILVIAQHLLAMDFIVD